MLGQIPSATANREKSAKQWICAPTRERVEGRALLGPCFLGSERKAGGSLGGILWRRNIAFLAQEISGFKRSCILMLRYCNYWAESGRKGATFSAVFPLAP